MAKERKAITARFKKQESYSPRSKKEKALIQALCSIKGETYMAAFLRDLLTLAEVEGFANRLEIARLIHEGRSYLEIAHLCDVSTTTVSRVAHWLYNGCGGYFSLLNKKN